MQQNSNQPYANVPYHQVQPINQPVVIQPVRVQPVRVQQVVVTQQPLVQQQGTVSEPFIYKQNPCFFWSLILGSVLGGLYMILARFYVPAAIVLAVGVSMSFTLRELTIRAEDSQIFIGWGPLRCCVCCLQEMTVQYSNVISYGEYSNQCWYPLGYHPAFFDPMGGDCCINWFFRSWCCCTNAFFYNAACIFCFFVFQAPQLIVLRLRTPVTCCCHTMNHIAISLPDSRPLRDFLHSKGLRQDTSNVSCVTQTTTVVSVQQQYAPVQQMAQVQPVQQPLQQVPMQQMHNEPLMQNENQEGGNTGEVYGQHLQQSQM